VWSRNSYRGEWVAILVGTVLGLLVAYGGPREPAHAQGITIPNTFTNFTTADATQVNANFTALANAALNRSNGVMTGPLSTHEITPGTDNLYDLGTALLRVRKAYVADGSAIAGLSAAQITAGILGQANGGTGKDTSGATDGQLLIGKTSDHSLNLASLTAGTGISITPGAGTLTVANTQTPPTVLQGSGCKTTTEQAVSTSVALTSVYDCTIAGGTLGTAGVIRLAMSGEYANGTGVGSTFAVNVVLGSTSLTSTTTYITIPASATHEGVQLLCFINANGATNQQRAECTINSMASGVNSNATWAPTSTFTAVHQAVAEDSTATLHLIIKVQHGTSDATIVFRRFQAVADLL
jgi:hypothetical protein